MIALVVVGKLNQSSVAPAVITRTSKPAETISVNRVSMYQKHSALARPRVVEDGKFRSWQMVNSQQSTE